MFLLTPKAFPTRSQRGRSLLHVKELSDSPILDRTSSKLDTNLCKVKELSRHSARVVLINSIAYFTVVTEIKPSST